VEIKLEESNKDLNLKNNICEEIHGYKKYISNLEAKIEKLSIDNIE